MFLGDACLQRAAQRHEENLRFGTVKKLCVLVPSWQGAYEQKTERRTSGQG